MITGNHYPGMPPRLEGESDDAYTNRLTGYSEAHDGPPRPYDHARGRQCSLGWHSECSQRVNGSTIGATGQCECPHHADPRLAAALPHITAFALSATCDACDIPADQVRRIEVDAVDVTVDALAAADKAALKGNP